MEDNEILQRLCEPLGGADVRSLAKDVPCSLLVGFLDHEDSRVARNAAWVLTHKPLADIRSLPQEHLIDLALSTPDTSLRRLSLCLVERQGIAEEDIRTDFLDFCLLHMYTPDEPPGVQSLCMKLAYSMCRCYPELMHEFQETLGIMQTEHYKPGVKHLINKIKKSQ